MSGTSSTAVRRYSTGQRVALAAVVVVGLLAAALVALHTAPARRWVRTHALEWLGTHGIAVSLRNLDYNLASMRASLDALEVRGVHADLPPLLTAERVEINLSATSLLAGRYVLDTGVIDGLRVHYVVTADGRNNLPAMGDGGGGAAGGDAVAVLLRDVQLRGGGVRYEDRGAAIHASLPLTRLAIRGNPATGRHRIEVATGHGTLRHQARTVRVDALDAIVDSGDDDVRIESVTVTAEGAAIAARGAIDDFADPVVRLDVEGSADLARAATLADLPEPLGGQLTVRGRVEGALGAPSVTAHVATQSLRVRALAAMNLAADVRFDAQAERLEVAALDVQAPFGRFGGNAALSLGDGRSHAALAADGLDAAPLLSGLGLNVPVTTRLDARIDAAWTGRAVADAEGEATATLRAPAATAGRVPVAGRLVVTARDETITAHLTGLRAPGAVADGTLRLVDGTRLDGETALRVSLDPALASVGRLADRAPRSLTPMPIRGDAAAAITVGGTLETPSFAARLTAPAVQLGDAAPIAVAADVAYAGNALRIDQAQLQWESARLTAAGTAGLAADAPIALRVEGTQLEVAELLRAAARPDVPATGTLTFDATVRGTRAAPAGEAAVRGRDLVAYGEPWGALDAAVALAGRAVRVPDLTVTKPHRDGSGTIAGRGTFHLDRRTLTAEVQSDDVRLEHVRLPGGQTVTAARVEFAAHVDGTLDEPRGGVTLRVDDATMDARTLGAISLQADVAGGAADLRAAAPAFGVTARGRVEIAAPYQTTATARLDDFPLRELAPAANEPLTGTASAVATVGGPLAEPADAVARVDLTALAGTWQGQPFELEAPATVRYEARRIAMDEVAVRAAGATARIGGDLPLDDTAAPGTLALEVRADLAALASYAPPQWALTAGGTLVSSGAIRGTMTRLDPDLAVEITGGALRTADAPAGVSDLVLRARVAGGGLTVETLDARVGDGRVTASGQVPLAVIPDLPVAVPRATAPGTLTARIEALPLGGLPGMPAAVGGTVALAANLTLPTADVKDVRGEVTFDTFAVTLNQLTLAQSAPTRLALENGALTLAPTTLDGTAGRLVADGTIAWRGGGPLSGSLDGQIDLGALAALADGVSAGGAADVALSVAGTTAAPALRGTVSVADASLLVDEPTLAVENLNAALALDGPRITLTSLTGLLNTGTLSGAGTLDVGDGGIAAADLEVTARDVVNDFPLDLRSVSTSALRLTGRDGALVLGGTVTVFDAGLTGDINFDEGILAALSARERLDLTEARNPLLESLTFDVAVRTTSPIVVENNLAEAEVTADVQVRGTVYEPGMRGQLRILEGGLVTLNERRYEVERGVVSFLGDREIVPSVDLGLRTTAQGYDITVSIAGPPGRTEASFISEPALPEPDIMAVLVTGRTLDEMRGAEFEVAREQTLSYLAGRVGSPLGRGLERATGLSSVRVEPELISSETNPGARLTVGQEITRRLELVYSVDLTNSADQIWMANYDATRRLRTSVVRQEDNSVRLDVRHDVRLGGQAAPERQRRRRPTVAAVHVLTDGHLPETEVRRVFALEPGDAFQPIEARRAAQRLQDRLREEDRLQARVHVERARRDDGIALTVMVDAGPAVAFAFAGLTPPDGVVDDVRRQWGRGVFDRQRLDDVGERLQAWLMLDGYFRGEIAWRVDDPTPDRRVVSLTITPGPRSSRVGLVFDGATALTSDALAEVVRTQDLERQLFSDPIPVTELLERYYTEQGYLSADVGVPRIEYDGAEARVTMRVTEGPRFVVGAVTVAGVTALREDVARRELALVAGETFLPVAGENALRRLRRLYWSRGFNDMRGDYALTVRPASGQVDLQVRVTEGPQTVVDAITVAGNLRTATPTIQGEVAVEPEQPLDLGALAASRSALYQTRAFSLVDIEQTPLPSSDDTIEPVALTVAVREVQPYQFRYGLSADTERGLGGLADLSSHNVLGHARVLGVRGRYDRRIREGRLYFNQPSLRVWPVETTASVYYRSDRAPRETSRRRLDLERLGLSVQQDKPLGDSYRSSLGFRLERARTIDPALVGLEERYTVAPLNATFTRDVRDDVLDAVRGSFTSHAVQFSPRWLGSDDTFLSYFGQFSHYQALQPPRRDPLTRDLLRPRLVFASSLRIGLAHAFGTDMPRGERFFGGGSTTLRGFAQDGLGPLGAGGAPLGGEALVVANGELRFPLLGMVDGVGFLDVGNVFARVGDIDLGGLRESAGVGLRVRTPWFLGRADLGVVLDRRPGERRWRLFFGIGQAF